jgi:hypothetical protein
MIGGGAGLLDRVSVAKMCFMIKARSDHDLTRSIQYTPVFDVFKVHLLKNVYVQTQCESNDEKEGG